MLGTKNIIFNFLGMISGWFVTMEYLFSLNNHLVVPGEVLAFAVAK